MNEKELDDKLQAELKSLPKIKPGGPEMESFLAAGYPDIGTREHAKELIAMREKDPGSVPWEIMQRAKAFLEALDAKPKK